MPTYITLMRFTQQGVKNIKDSPTRLDAAKKAFKSAGGEMKHFYLTFGRYDGVIIAEHPDDETAAKLALATSSQGNVQTETFRAFTEDEFRKMVKSLP
ncbi:MAG: GYD domain-containing protein [Deltaproteobacteria bacterium]|nr:GYD domain-containing protein [Deltaproteobacteria bacterium]